MCGRTELRGTGFLEHVNFAPGKVCEPAKEEVEGDHGFHYSPSLLYVKQYPKNLLYSYDMMYYSGLSAIINYVCTSLQKA